VPFVLVLWITWEHLNHHLAHKYEEHTTHDVIPSQMMSIKSWPWQG
jgi:hypothetical protein